MSKGVPAHCIEGTVNQHNHRSSIKMPSPLLTVLP